MVGSSEGVRVGEMMGAGGGRVTHQWQGHVRWHEADGEGVHTRWHEADGKGVCVRWCEADSKGVHARW